MNVELTDDQTILEQAQKIQNLQKMGRKIYKSHLNSKVDAARQPKSFKGLNQLPSLYSDEMSTKLQKGT